MEPFSGTAPADKAPFEPLKEASLKHLTFKTVFLLALVQVNVGVRFMLGYTKTSDTSQTGQGVPVPLTQLSLQEPAG